MGIPLGVVGELDEVEYVFLAFSTVVGGHLVEAEGDVFGDGLVGEECVLLEDEADSSAFWRDGCLRRRDGDALEDDGSLVYGLEARDDAENGGLAAAARPDYREHLA